jgi:V8-like Glu-specific endopeptidase
MLDFRLPWLLAALLMFASWLPASAAELRPQSDGALMNVNYRTPEFTAATPGPVRWQIEIERNGTDYLRLRIADVRNANAATGGAVNAVLKLRDRNGTLIREYSTAELLTKGTLWTPVVPGDYVLVSLQSDEPPLGFSLSIDQIAYQALAGAPRSSVGLDEKEPIARYADDPIISKVERSVAKISFVDQGDLYTCTGFLIEPGYLITNQHCVAKQEVCDTTTVVFDYEFDRNGILRFGEQYGCIQVVKVDFGLDYALLQLTGDPASKWGTLKLTNSDPVQQGPIFVVQHPAGQPKMISKINCLAGAVPVDGRAAGTDFTHSCDTVGGSSGAPIFNENGEVIGLHHYGFNEGGAWTENRGVRMLKIGASIGP